MKSTISALLLFFCIGFHAPAQEIELILEVSMDALNPSVRDLLSEFRGQVDQYISEHRWTNIDFHGDKIPVNMSINFTAGSESGDFTAQLVVASQRRIYENGRPGPATSLLFRALDPAWNFSYRKGIPFIHDEYQFNEIASVLDFYMYVVISLDFDSMELLQGTPYYQKALITAQRSQNSQRQSEWRGSVNQYSRMNLISELMNATYQDYRRAMYWYYYEGLDFLSSEPEPARQSIARALQMIASLVSATPGNSILLTMWLELQSSNFCRILEGYSERNAVMSLFAQVDPQRADMYRSCGF